MPRNLAPLPKAPSRSRWEWDGRTAVHAEHRRGVLVAETRLDLELRLAARGIAFELPPRTHLRRLASHATTAACCVAAAALCPAWAVGSVLALLAALAVVREVPA